MLDSTKKSAIQKTSSEHSDQATRVVMQSRHCIKSAREGATDIVTAPSRVVIVDCDSVDCDSDESMSSVEVRKTKSDSRGGKMLAKQVPSGDGSGSKILVPVPEEARRSKRQAVLAETKTSVQCMRDELSADDDFIVDSGKSSRRRASICNAIVQMLFSITYGVVGYGVHCGGLGLGLDLSTTVRCSMMQLS